MEIKTAVETALDAGYRLFDTAEVYGNEEMLAVYLHAAMQERGIDRSSVFVTTKLSPKSMGGYDASLAAIKGSLERLRLLEYVDLFLIHWPGASKLDLDSIEHAVRRREAWKVLEDVMLETKRIKFLGVSNYEVKHLMEMQVYAAMKPILNQIETHPQFHPIEVIQYCRDQGILVQAYSSLGRGELLTNPVVLKVAQETNRSVNQVLLRWAIQHQYLVLPKSVHPDRIISNADIFSFVISEEQMNRLDQLAVDPHKICWDPANIR